MVIAILLAVIAVAVVVTALALWRWGSGPVTSEREELCCRCNARIAGVEIHEIVAVPTDDFAIGIQEGGSFVAADFCAACCLGPGEGCMHPDHARLDA